MTDETKRHGGSLDAALTVTFSSLESPRLGPSFDRDLARRIARSARVRYLKGGRLAMAMTYGPAFGAVLLVPLVLGIDRMVPTGWLGLGLCLALVPLTLVVALAPRVPARILLRLVQPLLV